MGITRGTLSTLAVSNSTSSLPVTWASNPAAGSKVLIFLALSSSTAPATVTDNGTTVSAFTLDSSAATDINFGIFIYRADGISLPASGQYTVTVAVPSTSAVAGGIAYAGVTAGAPAAMNTGTGTAGTAPSPGAVTPSGPALYFGAFMDTDPLTAETITLNWASAVQQFTETNGATYNGSGAADLIGSGTQTPAWTLGAAQNWAASVVAYNAAPVSVTVTAAAVAAATAFPVHTVTSGSNAAVTATALARTTSVPAPSSVTAGSNAAGTVPAAAVSVPAPAVAAGTSLTAGTLACTASFPAPSVTAVTPGTLSAAAFSTAATPALTVPAPAPPTVQAGDLLLIWVFGSTVSLTFTSTGWTAVTAATGQNDSAGLLYKTAASADVTLAGTSGSYTVTCSGGTARSMAGILVDAPGYTFDAGAGVPASSGQLGAATSASLPVTGLTTTGAADVLLWFAGTRVASGTVPVITPPAGFTVKAAQLNTTTAAVNVAAYLATQVQPAPGATGTETGTLSGTNDGGGLLVALTPPASGSAAVTAAALTAATAYPGPSLRTDSAAPGTAPSAAGSYPAPAIATGQAYTAAAVTRTTSFPAPALGSGVNLPAAPLTAATVFPGPAVTTGETVTAAPLTATTALPPAVPGASTSITAATLACTAAPGTATAAAGSSAAVTAAAITRTASVTAPVTATQYSWMTTGQILDLLYANNPAVTAQLFDTPAAFAIGLASTSTTAAPFTSPLACTPILKYSSYAQFTADITAGAITYPYKWVLYDCEYWGGSGQTPAAEYNSPVVAMQAFCTLAHASGYKVMLTPGRDLAQAPSTVFPYTQGSLDAWYEANNIAGAGAAAGAEIVEIQTQADTLTGNFTSFWAAASAQVAAASAACRAFGGISVTYGTGVQMAAAALSIPAAAGFWLNGTVPTTATSVLAMQTWLGAAPVTQAVLTAAATFPGPAASAGQTATVAALAAATTAPATAVTISETVTASAVTPVTILPAAAVATGATAAAAPAAAAVSVPSAGISAGNSATIAPVTLTAAITVPALTIRQDQNITPATLAAAAAVPAPVVEQDQAITPATLTGSTAVAGPALSTGQTAAPAALAASVTCPAVTAACGAVIVQGAQTGTATIPPPAASGNTALTRPVLAASVTCPAVTAGAGTTTTLAALTGAAAMTVPGVTAGTSTTVTIAAVTLTTVIPAPVAEQDQNITPGAVAAQVTIAVFTATASTTATPDVLTVTGTVPGPLASGAGGITLTALTVTVTVTPPSVRYDLTITAVTVTAQAGFGFPYATGFSGYTGSVTWTAGPGPGQWTAAPAAARWKASP